MRLSREEKAEIRELVLVKKWSTAEVAAHFGRDRTTIWRVVTNNGEEPRDRAEAHRKIRHEDVAPLREVKHFTWEDIGVILGCDPDTARNAYEGELRELPKPPPCVTLTCDMCNAKFERLRWRVKPGNRYCSKLCSAQAQRKR